LQIIHNLVGGKLIVNSSPGLGSIKGTPNEVECEELFLIAPVEFIKELVDEVEGEKLAVMVMDISLKLDVDSAYVGLFEL